MAAALGCSAQAHAQQHAADAPPLRMERALGAGRATQGERIGPTTYARAQAISGEPDKSITLTGDAEIRREGLVLRGDPVPIGGRMAAHVITWERAAPNR